MKKVIAILLALVMLLSLAACGKDNDPTIPNNNPTGTPSASDPTGNNDPTDPTGGNDSTDPTNGTDDPADNTYMSALELFGKVSYQSATTEDLIKMAPNAYWAFYESIYGMSKESFANDAIIWVNEKLNYYKDTYGADLTVTIQVDSETAVSADELALVKANMQETKGIDPAAISAAYLLGVNYVLNGNTEYEEYQEFHVIQIDGSWYVGGWWAETDYCYSWFAVEKLAEAG